MAPTCESHIMSSDQRCQLALAVQPRNQFEDHFRRPPVQIARRLIGQEQLRLGDQRPGQRQPLLLASRKLAGAMRAARFKSHFAPTSSSWMNLVERFFADLTEDVIRTGSFAPAGELVSDINAYLAQRNANPRPYKWKAEGAAILEKIKRARAALDKAKAA